MAGTALTRVARHRIGPGPLTRKGVIDRRLHPAGQLTNGPERIKIHHDRLVLPFGQGIRTARKGDCATGDKQGPLHPCPFAASRTTA